MPNPHIHFVLSPFQNAFFHEVAEVLAFELTAAGVEASISDPQMVQPTPSDVFVLLPAHEYIALEGDPWVHDRVLLGRTIAILAEQPHQAHFAQNAAVAKHCAATFDFNHHAVAQYRRLGIDAEHLPFGYTSMWDRFDSSPEHRLDLVYLGSDEPRRQRVLATCADALGRHRCRLVISDNAAPNPGTSATFVVGEDKRRLLASSRVLLNIHRSDEPYFEWLRFIEAFHCGTAVLSEPSLATEPFVAGQHFVSADTASLPFVIDGLLADERRLAATREQAYEQLRRAPISATIGRLAAAAERLLDRPVPAALPPRTRTTGWPHPLDQPVPLDETSFESVIRQSLREIRLDIQGLRRQIDTLRRTVNGSAIGQAESTTAATTPSLAHVEPDVSVIMALYNHDEFVTEALDSVLAAQVDRTVEIIVVDDGSSDASADTVRRWMADHPGCPTRLVAHAANRGLPVARNTAVSHARAPRLFVLDADNAVLPGAIDVLCEALDANPEAAFAYGMLQCFTSNGPEAVMGVWPWQPKRLRRGNYIDAMALIRTDVVHALGGYTTDRRLYGWEDYDLWCRIADNGGHGVQVPNFVARYRRSPTSMVSLSNVSQLPSFVALAERCPTLASGAVDQAERGPWTNPSPLRKEVLA